MKTIYGIGVDIEEVKRFKNVIQNPRFLEKVFTNKEIVWCKKKVFPEQHFAGRFCAKEAIIKALSQKNVFFKDMEILNKKNGKPYVRFLKKKYHSRGFKCWLSLSHSQKHAIAFVVIGT